ncbi:divalent-cation tolerance protein CutA [Maricaulis maris]|uniref:Uncharacterized protein involved in tolerance to divalent cations n=1 Tax=Maricaulis maris TaxID=74318 RepID=A0A495DMD7_9PROT|nr:divalent-cation tolerance protein CutA [Maricaulis maris]RKR04086.1 uncharacterized protein involved in tolerance to divalent cations [Maricaulis maris]
MQGVCLIYTCWPNADTAGQAAARVVEEGLCACANILPGMTSVYRWQGEIETGQECVALFKTSIAGAPALRERLLALHPHDEPALLALPVDASASSASFLDWVVAHSAGS